MSKSYRIRLKAEEQDMLTGWRKVTRTPPGRAKAAKQSYNRRQRRALKPSIDD